MTAMPNDRTMTDAAPENVSADEGVLARAARIAEIRRQIAAGEYDTPERMGAALEAFLDSDDAGTPDNTPPRRVPR